ncbi:DUF4112 domain-containing protein [Acetobacter malorum]|uniref:DUF4112 domain-containing protein n=3 Tax=Acetobacter malorum TaxID=178901 RepID=A0A087PXC3_9PROT|nr:DUF4112 domain-containing protein [Acetobacter malorum]KFL92026.1 hypothetical protein AmDm5_0467 [Acetobacter malorum]KXV05195.1 hypothetical protein AD930_13755 [Acetobacter malorum]KXV17585.1 hypothetical protein AD933_04335 [Acetobacter malorum]KXV75089.1 hypothetical protein AD953_08940 [Acetobacter malorum]OAG78462.1 hypothetical protein Amal_00475 [Acetobacter malorum]
MTYAHATAGNGSPHTASHTAEDIAHRLRRVRRLAWILDAAFRLPGTRFRVGVDAIVGLLPVGGSVVMGLVSLYIVWEAWRLRAPTSLLARMVGNVLLETAVDTVPIAGDLFDAAFKANLRNVALLEQYFGHTAR